MAAIRSIVKPFAINVINTMEKTNVGKKLLNFIFTFQKTNRRCGSLKNSTIFTIKNITKFYHPTIKLNRGLQIKKLFSKIDIEIPKKGFIYSLDPLKSLLYYNRPIDNISVDYTLILNNSLENLRKKYENTPIKNPTYIKNQLDLIEGIEIFLNKEIIELKKSNRADKEKYISFLENIKDKKPSSFEEALQRILFYNQILWQTGHNLIGLGRLDKILEKFYKEDDSLTKEQTLTLIQDFLKTLNRYYWFKSNSLLGDTGQVIVLGGKEEDGTYFYNDLTLLFIKAIAELNKPDPKILLRVSENTPRFLIEESLKSINTGIGNPLLSNDDIIIPKLIEFGYEPKDAYNHVVSACWEPAPIAKGMEVNNSDVLIFIKPLNDMLDNEDLNEVNNFEDLMDIYKKYLGEYLVEIIEGIHELTWEEDPILSLFIDNCDDNQLDISKGVAKYNNVGLTTVSMSNTVNSLLNIKKLVFEDNKYTLEYLNEARKNNFEEDNNLYSILSNEKYYGNNNEEAINLTNEITEFTSNIFNQHLTPLGGKFKYGLSAPTYISSAEMINASFDGRKKGEPFTVHISQGGKSDYTGLMNFAAKLNYTDTFNGNVVDFITTPSFIDENFDKFVDFLMLSIKLGFFQMQMNVVSSETLLNAKKNPEKYQNLIVRVWGFSAYFNDLPESYQNVLIKRALINEGKATA